jgi:hypothetical protein
VNIDLYTTYYVTKKIDRWDGDDPRFSEESIAANLGLAWNARPRRARPAQAKQIVIDRVRANALKDTKRPVDIIVTEH